MDSYRKKNVYSIVINSIRLILVLIFLFSLNGGSPLMQFVSFVAFILTYLPWILYRYFGINLPAKFEVITLLFIYGLLFISEVRSFYSVWWWDILLNVIASFVLAFIGLSIMFVLNRNRVIDANPAILSIFAFCFAFSVGCLWEIFEFFLDFIFNTGLQKSLLDTMQDLIVLVLGSFIVSLFGYFSLKKNRFTLISTMLSKMIERNLGYFSKLDVQEKNRKIIENLISTGENERIEFKSSFRTNLHTKEFDRRIEHSLLKTIVAFLNTKGGDLLVGVNDSGYVLGLENDNFQNDDKMLLHLTNLIKSHIGNEFLPFIKYSVVNLKEKKVLHVNCKSSKKRVFLKINGEEEFYVRSGPSSAKLEGSSLVDYIEHKFGRRQI